MIRVFHYNLLAPVEGIGAFELAVKQRRALWAALAKIDDVIEAEKAALIKKDAAMQAAQMTGKGERAALAALRKTDGWNSMLQKRIDLQREAKQAAARAGLHFGNYNDCCNTFNGGAMSNKQTGGRPGKDGQRGARCTLQSLLNGKPALAVDFINAAPGGIHIDPGSDTGGKMPTGRKAARRAVLRFRLRGPKNPLGPADLVATMLYKRPIPPRARIKMVHVDRLSRPVNTRDGEWRDRMEWRVSFVCDVPASRVNHPETMAAVVFTGYQEIAAMVFDGRNFCNFARIVDPSEWQAARQIDDETARVVAFEKLRRRETHNICRLMKSVASRYGSIALIKRPQGSGVRHAETQTHEWGLRLKNAVEACGGVLVELTVAKFTCHACGRKHTGRAQRMECSCGEMSIWEKNAAQALWKAAQSHFLSMTDDPIMQEDQEVVA